MHSHMNSKGETWTCNRKCKWDGGTITPMRVQPLCHPEQWDAILTGRSAVNKQSGMVIWQSENVFDTEAEAIAACYQAMNKIRAAQARKKAIA